MTVPTTDKMQSIKSSMKATWMAGDFGQIAKRNEAEGTAFISRLGLKPGQRVLDVACGTGNLAIPAAKLGAKVTGVDIATNLIEQARARAKAEGVAEHADFVEGDAEDLQFPDASFDVVMTMYGAMFAPRPERTAAELLRVCRPGGFIAMANWTPEGFVGQMFALGSKHVPPPPGVPTPSLWGKEDIARQRFTDAAKAIGSDATKLSFEFHKRIHIFTPPGNPAETVEFFRTYFGPTKLAFERLDAPGQEKFRADLVALWTKNNRAPDPAHNTIVDAEYLEVRVHKG